MLEKIKRFPLIKFFYRIPGLVLFYHFLWSAFGAVFYGFPSRNVFVVGVTGTKGKTTTIELINSILEAAGKKTALLSSLRVKIGEKSEKSRFGNTMPGRFYIQRFLSQAVRAGCGYALIEVTSQGAAMSRHRFVNWNTAVLTNLSPEHIEAHGSFEKYRAAKLGFLKYAASRGARIFLPKDDANADFFIKKLSAFRSAAYSKNDEEIAAALPKVHPARAAADSEPEKFIWSDFNKDNAVSAIAVAKHIGIDEKTIEGALRHFAGVPGRMEFVQRKPFAVVIDYAHTPDSLRKVYATLRNSCHLSPAACRLICVLGVAGGGRDKWKRSEMGKIAAEYCDEIILTNEDPYDEQPEKIIEEIASGCAPVRNPPPEIIKISDRRLAVKKAISLAREGDMIVLTGKGSEDWIHVANGRKIPWSERSVVEEELGRK